MRDRGAPGWSACGGIFRDYRASAMGCLATNLGVSYSLHAEFMGVILSIKHAAKNGWRNVWLECDSQLVVTAFSSSAGVPWTLKNRWNNCLAMIENMIFIVTHIYRGKYLCT